MDQLKYKTFHSTNTSNLSQFSFYTVLVAGQTSTDDRVAHTTIRDVREVARFLRIPNELVDLSKVSFSSRRCWDSHRKLAFQVTA